MKRILITSDSHGNKKALKDIFSSYFDNGEIDMHIDLGDDEGTTDFIRTYLNKELEFHKVLGNMDRTRDEYDQTGFEVSIEIGDVHIYGRHNPYGSNHKYDYETFANDYIGNASKNENTKTEIFLHGHAHANHIQEIKEISTSDIDDKRNLVVMSPGSISEPRDGTERSHAYMEIDDHGNVFLETRNEQREAIKSMVIPSSNLKKGDEGYAESTNSLFELIIKKDNLGDIIRSMYEDRYKEDLIEYCVLNADRYNLDLESLNLEDDELNKVFENLAKRLGKKLEAESQDISEEVEDEFIEIQEKYEIDEENNEGMSEEDFVYNAKLAEDFDKDIADYIYSLDEREEEIKAEINEYENSQNERELYIAQKEATDSYNYITEDMDENLIFKQEEELIAAGVISKVEVIEDLFSYADDLENLKGMSDEEFDYNQGIALKFDKEDIDYEEEVNVREDEVKEVGEIRSISLGDIIRINEKDQDNCLPKFTDQMAEEIYMQSGAN
ncbi:MAG: metallophosphoesterase family protein [Clostridia bacterium]|jgi:predicted phosphodiesterase|nr:metallophosphoesterase family protein [Clostridia bacterium]